MDIKTQRDASRGRKSKAGGGKKSKATQEYTPLKTSKVNLNILHRSTISCLQFMIKSKQIDRKMSDIDGNYFIFSKSFNYLWDKIVIIHL